jgi:uncharacterized membrane protein
LLVKRGVTFPATLLAATVSANAVQAAPAGLVSAVSQAAAGTAVSAATLGLVKATVTSIGSAKTTLVALLTLAAGALSSSGIVASHFEFSGAPNAWMNPSAYLLLSLTLGLGLPALLIGLAFALPRIPSPASTQRQRLPGHREVLFDRLSRLLIGLACLDVAFQVLLQLLVFQANRQNPPHLSIPLAAGLAAAYLTLTTAWILAMCRHFQLRPKTAPASVPRGTEAPATLNEIEWRNPENWAGPAWCSIYHGQHDSRVWVPKQIPALGWTINFGHPAGRSWLIGLAAGLALALAVGTTVFLSIVN